MICVGYGTYKQKRKGKKRSNLVKNKLYLYNIFHIRYRFFKRFHNTGSHGHQFHAAGLTVTMQFHANHHIGRNVNQ